MLFDRSASKYSEHLLGLCVAESVVGIVAVGGGRVVGIVVVRHCLGKVGLKKKGGGNEKSMLLGELRYVDVIAAVWRRSWYRRVKV